MTAVLTMTDGCTEAADWPAIVRDHGPLVWKTAYRLLNQEADAADCFQETFISAMEVERREAVENWPGLLARLATARALDQLRRRCRERNHTTPGEFDSVASADASPVAHAEASELSERLRAALSELPARHSEVFCLRHISGLSYEEIAAQMRLSVDAVGVLLHRARGRLKELLMEGAVGDRKQR